jgi:hypothetical protein
LTTPAFAVQDKWEVRWDCPDVVSITIYSPDGAIMAGASSASRGSLYQPKGGSFYLQISRTGEQTSKWHVSVVQLGAGPAPGADASWANYYPPAPTAPGSTNAVSAPAAPTAPGSTNMVSAPTPPASQAPAPATNAPAAPAVPETMPENLGHAVVLIKGDVGEGTGFLVKTAEGPAVVTNNHVIRANPNLKILTTTGAEIKTLGLKGASDRDVVMFKIEDNHYTYFDLVTDLAGTVQAGDAVVTPGNSEGGGVVLSTVGNVKGIGPQQIEVSNPIYHGNSGGPVYHVKDGKVLAVVTFAMKVDTSNELDKASFANKNSAISGQMRYFGLRLDNVPNWETYDWNRFLRETTFLRNFHQVSRCLDSYLNGDDYEKKHKATSDEDGPPDGHYYLHNEKLTIAENNYHRLATNADQSQRLDAGREWVMTMEGVAQQDLDAVRDPRNFYSFNQTLAKDEVDYRMALKAEIQRLSDKLSGNGH